jgi:hypothetical protein
MTETIVEMVQNGLKGELLLLLFQLMVAGYILMYLKSVIVNEFAYRSFRTSLNICIGTRIRIPTVAGNIDGEIVKANRRRIVIETKETRLYVPTKTFSDRDWCLLKLKKSEGV